MMHKLQTRKHSVVDRWHPSYPFHPRSAKLWAFEELPSAGTHQHMRISADLR
jgi:hypothetical protein